MKRRDFNSAVLAGVLGGGLCSGGRASDANVKLDTDRYGGWKEIEFEPTGFFRVEKTDRWWLVTPEGNAFLSFGINHLHANWWQQDFAREAWQQRLGVEDLNDWPTFSPALRSWFLRFCREWGFNTAGVHTSLNVINIPEPALPYMQPITFVDIPHWKIDVVDSSFVDVFASDFATHCDKMAKAAAAPDDPFLIAYAMTDCPLLTEEDCRERPDVIGGAVRQSRIGWPRRLRNLGAHAAGKGAYVQTVQELYRENIADFNQTYGTRFDSFDALAAAENWRIATDLSNANETRDNVVFLKRCVDKYYQTARDAIRRYDSNHMFFGDKLNGNTDTVDTVLPITSQYTDAILYQMYGRYEVQEPGLNRWSQVADQPFINGDAAFTIITPSMPRPFGPVADSLQQRAEWTAEFFLQAFGRADFVGWHYCGLIDATQNIANKQDRQHSGLLNEFGEPYRELFEVINRCSQELYQIAVGKV